jgi:hypothetical protein
MIDYFVKLGANENVKLAILLSLFTPANLTKEAGVLSCFIGEYGGLPMTSWVQLISLIHWCTVTFFSG